MEAAEGGPLTSFLVPFVCAYLAAALLPGGVMHLVRLRSFATLLYSHGIVPPVLIVTTALAVGALETGLGVAALLATARVRLPSPLPPAALPAAAAALGAVFVVYLILLFNRPPRRPHSSCGCTLWESSLSGASLLPAAGLIVAGLLGLGAARSADWLTTGAAWALAALWGATLAPLVALIPAAVPDRAGAEVV